MASVRIIKAEPKTSNDKEKNKRQNQGGGGKTGKITGREQRYF